MALLTKKEFSERCGIKPNDLGTYVKRKKIVLSGDYVDDSILQNKEFLKKRLEKNLKSDPEKEKLPVETKEKVIKNEFKDPVFEKPEVPNVENPETSPDEQTYLGLEKKKKALDIEKISEEIEILKVKKDKLHGIVIPTEIVKALFSQHTKSILVEFSNSVDKIITKIAKRKSLNNTEVSEIRKELIDEINVAVDKSIDETKKSLKNVITEFSEKKGKGERT